jgi:acyl carrier protein
MTLAAIIQLLKSTLADLESVTVSASQIKDDDELIAGLGIDSLDYATVLVTCESELGVSVMEDDIDWRAVRTIKDLAEVLAKATPADG